MREKPTEKFFVNAGIYLLDPVALDYIVVNEPLDMPDLITRMHVDGKRAAVFPLHEYWIDVGRLDDLQRASAEYQGIFG
jgi:NDP-sugar pyrophosphorylase family protein